MTYENLAWSVSIEAAYQLLQEQNPGEFEKRNQRAWMYSILCVQEVRRIYGLD